MPRPDIIWGPTAAIACSLCECRPEQNDDPNKDRQLVGMRFKPSRAVCTVCLREANGAAARMASSQRPTRTA